MAMSCFSMWMRKITWKSSEITGKKQMSDMVCKVSNNDTLGDNVWLGGNTVVCQSDLHALSEGKSCWGIHKRIFHHSIIFVYILIASVAPVWALLQPRDYLNSYLLIFMIVSAAIGVFVANPACREKSGCLVNVRVADFIIKYIGK